MDSVAIKLPLAAPGPASGVAGRPAPTVPPAPPAPSCGLPETTAFALELRASLTLARERGQRLALLVLAVHAGTAVGPADACGVGLTSGSGSGSDPGLDPALEPRLQTILAARLDQAITAQEAPAHLGPGCFAVRLALRTAAPGAEASTWQARALALRAALQAPVSLDGRIVELQVQAGLACSTDDGADAATLLRHAHEAAALASQQGGLRLHGQAANAPVLRQWQLGQALGQAIARNQLQQLYQPKVSLDSGEIVGVECLLRWNSPEFGEVPAEECIALAESVGLIGTIGGWSLRQACLQAAAWQRAGQRRLRLDVNISQIQLHLGDLAQQVQAALIETGADPAALGIEITENSLMADLARATEALRELKALGIEISLDDFGTGSSSLGALQRLPIDVVNVDRSFVPDVTAAAEGVSVTRAIITMAHGMQLRVLAEGVQTEGQLGLLSAKGCDLIQGHVFSPAVDAAQIEQMLHEGRTLPRRLLRRRETQRTLLLVDDEENILSALRRLLRRDGYKILTASDGPGGLQQLAEHPVDVIISDQRMPGMSGVEFLRRAKDLHPHTVRITLSGFTELQSIIDAVNEGAIYKFLTKPWDDALLRAHVAEAFRQKEMADENRRLSNQVAHANAELEALSVRLAGLLESQREHSELLAASAAGTREMLDELPVAVLGVDPEGVVVYLNLAAATLLPQAQGAIGSAADEVFPRLLGQALPAPGSTLKLNIDGRSCRVLTHELQAMPSAQQGRGRLVLLIDNPCEATA